MSKSSRILLGLAVGVAVGAATAFALALSAAYMLDAAEVDRTFVKGVALYFAPMGALAGAIIWAIWAKKQQ